MPVRRGFRGAAAALLVAASTAGSSGASAPSTAAVPAAATCARARAHSVPSRSPSAAAFALLRHQLVAGPPPTGRTSSKGSHATSVSAHEFACRTSVTLGATLALKQFPELAPTVSLAARDGGGSKPARMNIKLKASMHARDWR